MHLTLFLQFIPQKIYLIFGRMDCQLPITMEINFQCLPSAIPHLISIAIGKHQKLVQNIYASIALSQILNSLLGLYFFFFFPVDLVAGFYSGEIYVYVDKKGQNQLYVNVVRKL